MTWATRRRIIVVSILSLMVAGIFSGTFYLFAHKTPTCTDGVQNQKEEGVDCGGTCPYLCSISQAPPSVRFVRPVSPSPGRTDVVAYIDNPNPTAGVRNLHYTIELYSPTNAVVATKEGETDLPPTATMPVFVPNFFSGSSEVSRAFITFDEATLKWFTYKDERIIPLVRSTDITPGDQPRITALVENPSAERLSNVKFVITVFGADGNAMAASQTIAPSIPPQGTANLIFTWSKPFASTPSRVEVLPIVPIPGI